MRRAVLILILMGVLVFAVTKDDVLKASREDINEAIRLLKLYIAEHPGENVEDLGKLVYTKKKLSSDPDIGKAVLKEDFDALLEGLIKKGKMSEELLEELGIVFDIKKELQERILKFDENAFKFCEISPKRIDLDPEPFAELILEKYLEDPLKFDVNRYLESKCFDRKELKEALSKAMEEKFKEGEKYYVQLWTLAKNTGIDFPHLKDLEDYVDLLMDVESSLKTGVSSDTYYEYLERLKDLKVEKEMLSEKIASLKNVIIEKENPKRDTTKKRPVLVYIAVTVISTAIFLVIFYIMDSRQIAKRLKRKIEKDPLNPDLHVKLAEIYERLGRIEDAMEEYRIASKLEKEKEKEEKNPPR